MLGPPLNLADNPLAFANNLAHMGKRTQPSLHALCGTCLVRVPIGMPRDGLFDSFGNCPINRERIIPVEGIDRELEL